MSHRRDFKYADDCLGLQGGIVGSQFGAVITIWLGVSADNLDKFWVLVLISNVSSLLPLVLIGWVPATDPQLVEKLDDN